MKNYLETHYDLNDPDLVSVIDDLPIWSAPFGLKLLDIVELKPNLKVLDIGSGMGFPIIELSQRLGNTCQVYGIDPWEAAIERVKLKMKIWDIQNIQMITGKAEQLDFENNYFDLIVSNNGTNNVDDEEKVFSEISRAAKNGSQLIITLNLPETMMEFYEVFEAVLQEYGKSKEIQKLKDHIWTKRKPLDYTKNLIEKNRFIIKDIFEDSFKLRFLDGSTMINHFLIKLAFIGSWKSILRQEEIEKIFEVVEKKLNEIAEVKGELTLTVPWVCINSKRK